MQITLAGKWNHGVDEQIEGKCIYADAKVLRVTAASLRCRQHANGWLLAEPQPVVMFWFLNPTWQYSIHSFFTKIKRNMNFNTIRYHTTVCNANKSTFPMPDRYRRVQHSTTSEYPHYFPKKKNVIIKVNTHFYHVRNKFIWSDCATQFPPIHSSSTETNMNDWVKTHT